MEVKRVFNTHRPCAVVDCRARFTLAAAASAIVACGSRPPGPGTHGTTAEKGSRTPPAANIRTLNFAHHEPFFLPINFLKSESQEAPAPGMEIA